MKKRIWQVLGGLTVAGAIVAGVQIYRASVGYCHEVGRPLTDSEAIDRALAYEFGQPRPSGLFSELIIKYKNKDAFLSAYPGCCRIIEKRWQLFWLHYYIVEARVDITDTRDVSDRRREGYEEYNFFFYTGACGKVYDVFGSPEFRDKAQ